MPTHVRANDRADQVYLASSRHDRQASLLSRLEMHEVDAPAFDA